MTDDIPSLIERLRAWKSLRACDFEENSPLAEDLEAAAQALSRLTAFPLAEEIAGLIERLRRVVLASTPGSSVIMEAAAAIEQQARKIERLKADAVPLCIGRPLIGILAKQGAWSSSDGRCVVAADDLLGADPYDQIDKLRETLSDMYCQREINPITIADCTRRNQCRCSAGAVFVKTGAAQG